MLDCPVCPSVVSASVISSDTHTLGYYLFIKMVFNRKRKDNRSSRIILDDSPKRAKVQAQRKFAQGSNVNSPVLTPVTELEVPEKIMPEAIELQPMKRPNTEDFLTFLCFRGTPALPPNLNFFNNVSMNESQPLEPESQNCSKNGVILPANISKLQGGKPFIAFGVRKRADPIVVSRHMDKKRRHALALQALRRKYQEQKMAKIRAITISNINEKVHNSKTMLRASRTLARTDPPTKKPTTQKAKIAVVAAKHVKIATRRTSIQIKQRANTKLKMCLRNFKNKVVKHDTAKDKQSVIKQQAKLLKHKHENNGKTVKQKETSTSEEEKSIANLIATRRNKQLLLRQQNLNTPTLPCLRSQLRRKILQKTELTVPKRKILTRKVQLKAKAICKSLDIKKEAKLSPKSSKEEVLAPSKKKAMVSSKPKTDLTENKGKSIQKIKEELEAKTKSVAAKNKKPSMNEDKTDNTHQTRKSKVGFKSAENKISIADKSGTSVKSITKSSASIDVTNSSDHDEKEKKVSDNESCMSLIKTDSSPMILQPCEEKVNKKRNVSPEKAVDMTVIKKEVINGTEAKVEKKIDKKDSTTDLDKTKSLTVSQRPTRKTKVAAAIYMEILGRKLVNDEDIEDLSNDSFPELPNIKRIEQRENELKAAKIQYAKTAAKKRNAKNNIGGSAEVTKPIESKEKTKNSSSHRGNSSKKSQSEAGDSSIKKRPVKRNTSNQSKSKVSSNGANKEYFSDSDEEPLSRLTQKANHKVKMDSDSPSPLRNLPKEGANQVQNCESMFSSSDEEKLCRLTKKKVIPKAEPLQEALSTKDIGRRFGKEKVNMSNEQIEKWLNDSAMAGITLIKAENDKMLKFGERIPTETSLDANMDAESGSLKLKEKAPISTLVNTTPEKLLSSPQKPSLNEKRTIFRKADKLSKNANAFSVCNESSVYAFEADTEDTVSTPFRRPSRRPSSTSRSEDDFSRVEVDNKLKLRWPTNSIDKPKQEVSLMLTDESNHSGSITLHVNLAPMDNDAQGAGNSGQMFYIPFQPGEKASNIQGVAIKMGTDTASNSKLIMSAKLVSQSSSTPLTEKVISNPMFPPSCSSTRFKKQQDQKSKSSCNMSEISDEFKYKIPSSPSASSSSSAKLVNKKRHNEDLYKPVNVTEFPNLLSPANIVEAPIFHPTEKEFVDPLEYIEKIREKAERFGICRVVPPSNFKPECKVLDEMRFTAYNQYIHKMMHRWGPNFRELVAIRKYLATQNINLKQPPWIGGIEVDLPKLYETVQILGGLKDVIEKKRWPRVAELMNIPKSAQDRVSKLDDIYCKYILPYDTLSQDERDRLFEAVDAEWAAREAKMLEKAKNCSNPLKLEDDEDDEEEEDDDECDETDIECIIKGRSMALSAFYRIARNTRAMWFKEAEPTPQEVEDEFWKHVAERQHHICVHSGSIDSGNFGYGFAVSKNSPFARHAWNLKVLTNNSRSILRSMGPVMGLTVPTLHVGMLYAGCCWYRDPHSLPWIEYLHTGANKIWYGIPDSMSNKFHEVMVKLVPHYCLNKSLWLPTDTVMVPPKTLVDNGVSLTKTVQEPGQFVVIFPKAFTSNICAGYVVSESVFWAPPEWLKCADEVFLQLRNNCEPSMFSYERLLLSLAEDSRTDINVLRKIISPIERMIQREQKERVIIKGFGIKKTSRLPLLDVRRKKKMQDTDTEYICDDCRWNLYCSMIFETTDNAFYCLEHAIQNIKEKRLKVDNCKFMYTYDDNELNGFVEKIYLAIETKLLKKNWK